MQIDKQQALDSLAAIIDRINAFLATDDGRKAERLIKKNMPPTPERIIEINDILDKNGFGFGSKEPPFVILAVIQDGKLFNN